MHVTGPVLPVRHEIFSLAKRLHQFAAIILLVFALGTPVHAQDGAAVRASLPQPSAATLREAETIRLEHDRQGIRLKRAQVDRMIAEDEHLLFTVWKQGYTDIVLTIFVLLIVSVGVYLSYLQFKVSYLRAHARVSSRVASVDGSSPEAPAGEDGSQEQRDDVDQLRTNLKISREGVEMSSSVIGLFILLASMFFFYLYIDRVYPVRVIGAAPPAEGSAKR